MKIPTGMMDTEINVNFQLMENPMTPMAKMIKPILKIMPSNKEVAAIVIASKSAVTLEIKSPLSNFS